MKIRIFSPRICRFHQWIRSDLILTRMSRTRIVIIIGMSTIGYIESRRKGISIWGMESPHWSSYNRHNVSIIELKVVRNEI